MENDKRAPRRATESGPAGRRAARNLEQLRTARGLSQDELADATERLGRPLTRQMIGKTESGDRRLDVDDLMTFAMALRTTPNRLLLTSTAAEDQSVEMTPEYSISELAAWLWASGEHPLPKGYDAPQLQIALEVDRERWFKAENQPHRPPDAPAGVLLRDHPDVVQALTDILDDAEERGIGLGQLLYGLETLHFVAVRRTRRAPKPGGDDGQG